MKNSFKIVWLLLFCAGCFLFEPFGFKDSLFNATSQTWTVTANFSPEKTLTYNQGPKVFMKYSRMNDRMSRKDPMPMITFLSVHLKGDSALARELGADDLMKLRRASDGKLNLILFDEGIAAMPPEVKNSFPKTHGVEDYTDAVLKTKQACLVWTREVLSQK